MRGTPAMDIIGQTFGRLTVVSRHGQAASGNARWLCSCACGASVAVTGSSLRGGKTKSCGCLATERLWKHNRRGLCGEPRAMVDYRDLEEMR